MPKTRTTLTIDEDILRSTRVAAAHRGMKEGDLIEEALNRHLGLGVFERLWESQQPDPEFDAMSEDELMDWVVQLQHDIRNKRRKQARARRT